MSGTETEAGYVRPKDIDNRASLWQRVQWRSLMRVTPGISCLQTGIAHGQRGANGQPGGGLTSTGGSALVTRARASPRKFGFGTAEKSSFV